MTWPQLATLHLIPTVYMTGLIWFVQVVHYPLFAQVGERSFRSYEQRHCQLTTFVVLPAMIAELALAAWLCYAAPPAAMPWAIAGAVLLAAIWAATFLVQVPCHNRLQLGADHAIVRRLVVSNWLRTIAWTARTVVAILIVWPQPGP